MLCSVPISALQHFVFCPRQCAYIHIECAWEENYLTAQGNQLHERVHSDGFETRGAVRTERGVHVCSERLGIVGKLDLLEVGANPFSLTPVEYKRGKPKVSDCDRVQLCAHALCLEEMRDAQITRAALWYWQVRKRRMGLTSATPCAPRPSKSSRKPATCLMPARCQKPNTPPPAKRARLSTAANRN